MGPCGSGGCKYRLYIYKYQDLKYHVNVYAGSLDSGGQATISVNMALVISQLFYMLQNTAQLILRRHYNAQLQTC